MLINEIRCALKNILLGIAFSTLIIACNESRARYDANDTKEQSSYKVLKSPSAVSIINNNSGNKSCIIASFDLHNNLNLINVCQSRQLLDKLNIKFVSQDVNGNQIILGKFHDNVSGISIEFSSDIINQQIGKFTSENQTLAINADAKVIFSNLMPSHDQAPFDYNWANKTFSFSTFKNDEQL